MDIGMAEEEMGKLYIRCFSYFISISACNTCAIVTFFVFIKGNLT